MRRLFARCAMLHGADSRSAVPACRIAFANHKGGSGKTTTCLSVAGFLAKAGHRVLVVDFDPQGNATSGLGIDKQSLGHTIYDAMLHALGQGGVPLVRVIVGTEISKLHVAPSEFDLSVSEQVMQHASQRCRILADMLERVLTCYDFILIDLPPTTGLLTLNGLCAADQVVVPVEPSVYALETVEELRKSFRLIQERTGHVVTEFGAVLIRANGDEASREVEQSLREMFASVFVVPKGEEIYRSQKAGMPISHLAPKTRVGKAYEKLAKAIIHGNQVAETTTHERARSPRRKRRARSHS